MLQIENLKWITEKKVILDNINLKINEGEIHSILGVNGVGKSTLAYILMGLPEYKPCKGKIIFKGKDITNFSISQRAKMGITLLWQEPARFEGIKVKEYLNLNNKLKEKELENYLKMVGLEPKKYLEREMNESLSGGERKRIELASILSFKPTLAILDEPDSGIDILALSLIYKTINFFKKEGSSVILITHSPDATLIADKTSLMCGGKIIKSGSPQDVIDFFKKHCNGCSHINIIDEKLIRNE